MKKLKNRNKPIPYGITFLQPETGWTPRKHSSFNGVVMALISHRLGNHSLSSKGLSTDIRTVEDEVEKFNVRLCEQMGWTEYIVEAAPGGSPRTFFPNRTVRETGPAQPPPDPKSLAAVAVKIKSIWSGVRTLNDWLDSNTPPVESASSARRASVCAACPKNTAGDFTAWFTVPAAKAIQHQIEKASSRNLKTPHDDKINVCDVCLCPLKLKVHTPIHFIKANLSDENLAGLKAVSGCWIIKELGL